MKEGTTPARRSQSGRLERLSAQTLVGIGALVVTAIWICDLLTANLSPLDEWALPLLALSLFASFALFLNRNGDIDTIGYLPALALNAYLVVGVHYNILPNLGRLDSYQFYSTAYWLPVGPGVSFIFLAPRIATIFSLSMLAMFVLPIFAVVVSSDDHNWHKDAHLLIMQIVLAQVIFILLFLNVAVMRSRIAETYKQNKVLQTLSSTDGLTGLLNRRALLEVLQNEIAMALDMKIGLTVVMIDVDRFKAVNDQFGHEAGDAVLVHLARLLTDQVRSQDYVGRWGGEEFLLIASATNLQNGTTLAERLREAVAKEPFPFAQHVTISLGVAELNADGDVQKLLRRADKALYCAKMSGRNQTALAA